MEMTSAFNLTVRLDNVAVIAIDVPDEKMNTLKAEFGTQVRAMLRQIRENKAIRGLVFISAKPDNFIAGADINMIARAQSAGSGRSCASGAAGNGRDQRAADPGDCRDPRCLFGWWTGAGAGLPQPHLY